MTHPSAGRIAALGLVFARHQLALSSGRRSADGLTQSAYLLLACLDAGGPMAIGELADGIGLDVSTLNRQTAALVREGLAERIPDPAGGLARKFRPTADGRAAFERERDVRAAATAQILAGWSDADTDALAVLLDRFNLAIEARNGHHWPRA